MDLKEAIRHLDLTFGEGFGIENPDLVIEYMKAHGLNNLEHQIKPVMDHLTTYLNEHSKVGEALSNIALAIDRI